MNKGSFTKAIHAEADKLKINPKFLLFSIMALAETEEAKESQVFKPYYLALYQEMKEAAILQQKSKRESMRQPGEAALSPITEKTHGVTTDYLPIEQARVREYIGPEETITHAHIGALNYLLSQQQKTILAGKRSGYNGKFLDAVQIIKFLCPELVEAPIKLTTSGRGKLTTCFAGEDLVVQVCQC